MQKILYGGEEFLTGDEIADALLAYGRALGDDERAEIVEIPVVEDDGSIVEAKFLIGPASQIVAKQVKHPGEELVDHDLVARLKDLTRAVESPTAGPLEISPGDVPELD